jgi:transporter family-2 protein
MKTIYWIMLAFVAGAFLPIQAGLNAKVGKIIESPINASLVSFVVGAFVVFAFSFVTQQHVIWAGMKSAPAYLWLPGFMGAFYVTTIILAFPRIGAPLTFGLVVAGQMTVSVILDHFKVLVAQQHSIDIWKVLGVLLVISGVIIIRKF